jgi:ubiquinone/menaquinone biosynthesis C-methylase UbiE
MPDIKKLSEIWETNADEDAMWAVLTDPNKRNKTWDRDAFFETGKREINAVFNYLKSKNLNVPTDGVALDFGCGVGRLTQSLARYFPKAEGVDIARSMVDQARKLDQTAGKCEFFVNKRDDLRQFEDAKYVFIYSSIVLQHMDPSFASEYIKEFVRLLKPQGLLVFQIPDQHIPPPLTWRDRYHALRASLAIGTRLRRLFGAKPKENSKAIIEMNAISEADVRKLISQAGGEVVDVAYTNSTDPDFNGAITFSNTQPASGFISKQYAVKRLV